MLDEETRSCWSHITGEALLGPLKGRRLTILPTVQTTWKEWIEEHPDSKALKKERQILSSHYENYFRDPERIGILATHRRIQRLPAKTLVHSIAIHPFSLAIAGNVIKEGEFIAAQVGPNPISITRGLDNGIRAFLRQIGDMELRFRQGENAGELLDEQTASIWDIEHGECISGERKGDKLPRLNVTTAFWFAWSTFYHGTELIEHR